ncbi:MAG TPA: endolytic transglycosylase MltG [Thermoleophilaceae bacterium]|nr:endolytic transglycosylase MltG [Thermoleophilaceae bacterium]
MSERPPRAPGGPPPGERRPPDAGHPDRPDRPPTGDADPARAPRPASRRRLALVLGGGLVLVLVAWFLLSLFQPFAGGGKGSVQVAIPRGSGVGAIGDLLERRGVVSSSFFFGLRARLSGKASELKPGVYSLRRDISYGAALDALSKGPPPNIVRITIPEGRSRREIARIVDGSLTGGYLAATRGSALLSPRRYGAPRGASLEGFLFPATYVLRRGRPVSDLVNQQLAAFKREFAGVDLRYARTRNVTPYDVLTIASMIEREAAVPRDRALIASVIYNRLHAHMPLQIDATVRYAFDDWTHPLTDAQLHSRSPYNTYTRLGLPVGPIGNPGLASIEAAAHPARTRFLYFVVKPCGNGEHAFSSTYAQFQRDSRRYSTARQRRGGRAPNRC